MEKKSFTIALFNVIYKCIHMYIYILIYYVRLIIAFKKIKTAKTLPFEFILVEYNS